MKNEVKYYHPSGNNEYRNERYKFLSDLNKKDESIKYGKTKNGNKYFHLIEYDDTNPHNLLNEKRILNEVNIRFKSKAGDKKRVLTNMLSSQSCCFNLFAPLKFEENKILTNLLFSNLLGKKVIVSRIEIEFTPSEKESIGDQSTFGGTDSDLAIFYESDSKKKGLILMEFKYIEEKFSLCTSYKNKYGKTSKGIVKPNIRPICNSLNFLKKHKSQPTGKLSCGYLRYKNWELTEKSKVFDYDIIKNAKFCPFRFSLNQLWRNLLLAEQVSKINKLDEFHFWVLSPNQNTKLWHNNSENIHFDFNNLLTKKGKKAFRKLDIETDFVNFIEKNLTSEWSKNWIRKFREKYIETKN